MAATRVDCTACGAEQSSPHGFLPGEDVRCRACGASFRVPDRIHEDEDEPDRRSRWLLPVAVLVIIAVVGVGVYGAAVIWQRERAERAEVAAEEAAAEAARRQAEAEAVRPRPRVQPRQNRPPDLTQLNPLASAPLTKEQAKKTADALAAKLIGAWSGAGREVEYRADGTFSDGSLQGTWKAATAAGSRALAVERSAGRSPLRVAFEGDELIHDSPDPGRSDVLRRKP